MRLFPQSPIIFNSHHVHHVPSIPPRLSDEQAMRREFTLLGTWDTCHPIQLGGCNLSCQIHVLKTCSNQQKSVLKPNVLEQEQLPIPDVSDHRVYFILSNWGRKSDGEDFVDSCLQSGLIGGVISCSLQLLSGVSRSRGRVMVVRNSAAMLHRFLKFRTHYPVQTTMQSWLREQPP
jgi:hypothetical protein